MGNLHILYVENTGHKARGAEIFFLFEHFLFKYIKRIVHQISYIYIYQCIRKL